MRKMDGKLLHYKFNDDGELFEHWYEGNIEILRPRELEDLCEEMGKMTHGESCGDQDFPMMFHIYDKDKKYIASYRVDRDYEPEFNAYRQEIPHLLETTPDKKDQS